MKMKMTERELAALVESMVAETVTEQSDYIDRQEKFLKYYNADPFGDEQEGRSQVISTDVMDLVESDMPSLARVFLGAGDPVEFKPVNRGVRQANEEAKQRQAYVSHIIRTMPESFRTQHAWLKGCLLQDISALEYGCSEVETTREKEYHNLDEAELTDIIAEIESDPDVSDVEIIETSDDEVEFDVKLRITYMKKEWFMRYIPPEDFLISRNATCKNDAELVGKRFKKRRGELIADGLSYEFVDSLPTSGEKSNNRTSLADTRYQDQGGDDYDSSSYIQWANQTVEGIDAYVLADFDGDGIAERRHIIQIGNQVIENDPMEHVPYALASAILMPASVVGKARAELAMQYQRIQSVLLRGIADNGYAVSNPRTAIDENVVDVDDMLDIQLNGIVRVDGAPMNAMMPLTVPYIADQMLQIVSFIDGKKQVTTGSTQGNQALQADNLHKETATRTDMMESAATAKIELVARVIAETGYRDLWEGIAWFAKHYQDADLEVRVLGRELAVNPTEWKYDHHISAAVGTGAGDDEKTMQNLTGLYQIQQSLLQTGSPLVDQSKIYHTVSQMVKVIGRDSVEDFFNDPRQPDQIVQAERDMLKQMVQQLEMNMKNPLAEAEQVKAQGQMQIKMMEQKQQAQLEMMKMQQKQSEEINKLRADFEKQLNEMQFKYTELAANTKFDYTKLEVENSVDVEGEGQ